MSAPEPTFIENDPPIVGQNFVLLSFISPERVIKQREQYLMMEFVRAVFSAPEGDEATRRLVDIRAQFGSPDLSYETVNAAFLDWLFVNEDQLTERFNRQNSGLTSVRCLKVRGVYDTEQEADHRAKQLQKRDPLHNVYKARVGYWLPWEPDSSKIANEQYLEDGMQNLYDKYMENQRARDAFFQQQKQDALQREAEARREAAAAAAATATAVPIDPAVSRAAIQDLRDIANAKEAGRDFHQNFKESDPWMSRREASAAPAPAPEPAQDA